MPQLQLIYTLICSIFISNNFEVFKTVLLLVLKVRFITTDPHQSLPYFLALSEIVQLYWFVVAAIVAAYHFGVRHVLTASSFERVISVYFFFVVFVAFALNTTAIKTLNATRNARRR